MVDNYKILHIGGHDHCIDTGNPNGKCVLEIKDIGYRNANGENIPIGVCVFCLRRFLCIDLHVHADTVKRNIKESVFNNHSYYYIMHPINYVQSYAYNPEDYLSKKMKFARGVPQDHYTYNDKCNISGITDLNKRVVMIYWKGYEVYIPYYKCDSCKKMFIPNNISLSKEFDEYNLGHRTKHKLTVYHTEESFIWDGIYVGKGFYYGYDEHGRAFITDGKRINKNMYYVIVNKNHIYGTDGWKDIFWSDGMPVMKIINRMKNKEEREKYRQARISGYSSMSYVNNRHRDDKPVDYYGVSKKPFQGGDFTPD